MGSKSNSKSVGAKFWTVNVYPQRGKVPPIVQMEVEPGGPGDGAVLAKQPNS